MREDFHMMTPEKAPHPIHPAMVHFPVTLFPLSAVFILMGYGMDNRMFMDAAYWTFLLGCLAVLPVAITGIVDMKHARHVDETGQRTMGIHMRIGILLTALSLFSGLYFLFHNPMETPTLWRSFTTMAFAMTFLVFIQGFIGGVMVYTHRIGTQGHRAP